MANNLYKRVQEDLKSALKQQNEDELRTLRFLLAEINNLLSDKYSPEKGGVPANGVPDEDIVSVLQRQVKTHRESIEAFKAGNRQDLVNKEEKELSILKKYLPEQMSEDEIKKVVAEVKAGGLSDFGQIMKEVMARLHGKADGAVVSRLVRESL